MANADRVGPGREPSCVAVEARLVGSDVEPDRPEPSELASLLSGAAGGDQAAWRAIVDLYGRRVFAMARSRRLRRDLAEEVTQSVFATVAIKLRQAGGYSEQGRFESWLFRITINRVRDELRRLGRHAQPTDPHQFQELIDRSSTRSPEERHDALATFAALREALDSLPEADRDVIELRHHGGLEFKRIAEILGQPIGTVLARHHRALRKLKQLLESELPKEAP